MLSPVSPANLQTAPAEQRVAEPRVAEAHDVDRGWRRAARTPSLAEVFGSIKTRPTGPLWRKLLTFLGPGYLVAVGYMDPGNWATSLAGGSKFGYALLSIALLSNLMAILLQALCTRLGVASGRDLAQACRDAFPRWASWPLWAAAEFAICATDLAEVIGTAIGLNLLFGIPLELRRAAHRARRVSHSVDAAARLPLCGGLRRHPVPRHRGLFRHSDRHGRSGLGAGHPRLRAHGRDREESRDAVSGARHHRRHGHAA